MIEQIINWWNGLGDIQLAVGIMLFAFGAVLAAICDTIRVSLKDKRKTTTQKYREGLIKK